MSAAPDEPPWDRLPDDPLGFFGLGAGFDPQELRRRYGRLIKRYRPERDPDAFQRIRAAYEALQDGAPAPPRVVRLELDAPPPAQEPQGERAPSDPAATPGLAERLRGPEGAGTLQALREGEPATLEAALARALLAPAGEAIDHLYAALHTWPGQPQLLALLGEHLAGAPLDEAERHLRRAAALPAAAWLRVSAGLWRSWIRGGDPARVEAVWQELVERRPGGGARALLVAVVRPAALRLSDAWLDAATARLSELDRSGPGGSAHEPELIQALRDYRRARADFLRTGDPWRARLDRVIVLLADGEPEGSSELLRALIALQEAPELALTALRDREQRGAPELLEALTWQAWDLVERGELEPARSAALGREDRGRGLVTALLVPPTWLRLAGWLGGAVAGLALIVTPIVLVVLLVEQLFGPHSTSFLVPLLLGVGWGARGGIAVPVALCTQRARAWVRRARPTPRARRELGLLVAWGAVDLDRALEGTEATLGPDLATLVRRDPGLRLLALAAGWACA